MPLSSWRSRYSRTSCAPASSAAVAWASASHPDTRDDGDGGQVGRRLMRPTGVDLMVPFPAIVDPPTGAGARCRHAAGADQERAQIAERRVRVLDRHGPSVGVVRRCSGHRHVAADAHQRACGTAGEEVPHGEIGGEALADAARIDDETRRECDRRAVGSMTMSPMVGPCVVAADDQSHRRAGTSPGTGSSMLAR